MKLTYLGTAAAEGFPALFCNCQYCAIARRLGGKNVRTRSQSLVNDDLLIDFPADTYHHFLQNGIEGDRIRYLILTHAHSDHLYPKDLSMRHGAFAHDMRVPTLTVVGSEKTLSVIGAAPRHTETVTVKAFETLELGAYRVTALPARHMPGGDALFYVISDGEKTLLYAHDTGYFYEEVFSFLAERKLRFDMISFDCTNVDLPISDEGSHMGFPNIGRVLDRLKAIGAADGETTVFVNHFSHNANPLHSVLCARAEEYGYGVSYDGCTVEF
ncbi:MAG: MBL fold metallo-hydrolase [Clostridia bacterium]|nr:MBL fold metallo-hydrolase [Clostridia bacterium]